MTSVASYGANLVRIIVGPEKVLSIVHVEALTTVSGWFSEKLSKDFDFQNDPIRYISHPLCFSVVQNLLEATPSSGSESR